MTTLFLTIGVVAICFFGMAIGLILKKKPLGGSCGGASAKPAGMECDGCTGDGSKCDEKDMATNVAADRALPRGNAPSKGL